MSLGFVLFAGGFASEMASALVNGHGVAGPLIWLPGGLLLATLMNVPTVRWPSCILGAAIGVMLAAALRNESTGPTNFPLLLTVALVPFGAYAMRVLCGDLSPLNVFRNFAWFVGTFVFALPAVTSVAYVFIGEGDSSRDRHIAEWLQVGLANALGYILFAPTWLRPRARWTTLKRMFVPNARPAIAALVAIALIALLWTRFGNITYVRPLLLLAPIPVFVFTAQRAGVAGAYVLVVLIAIVAIQVTRADQGPFIEADATLTALSLKSWVFAAAVAAWLLSGLIEHRADVRRALAHSSREIRELAGRLIEAQELERSRIARDLHDGVSQRLASVSIELSTIRRAAGERSRVDLGHLQDELIGLSEDVRHLSHNLHPSMLHETGLEAALASLCNTQRHRNGPSIDLRVMPNADNLPDAIALCLYRTVQEALNNAIRHARAHAIEIRLGIIDEQAQLNVDDDGIGFSKARESGQPRGLGLLSLEERAKLLGGTFQLATGPGTGTHVCTRIPLQSRPR